MRPSLVYDTSTIYRRWPTGGTDVIGLLGVEGPDLISIPFFASDRVTPAGDMKNQPDPANLIDIPNGPSEQERFFGCWLDINQPDSKQFPASPGMATNFSQTDPGQLRSIHALIGSFHQCVVAEVHYKFDVNAPDVPHQGDSPSSSDKLAQRNLTLVTALAHRKTFFFPSPHSAADRRRRPGTPFEDSPFHVLPLGVSSLSDDAFGLLLLGDSAAFRPELHWFTSVFSQKLDQILRQQTLAGGGKPAVPMNAERHPRMRHAGFPDGKGRLPDQLGPVSVAISAASASVGR